MVVAAGAGAVYFHSGFSWGRKWDPLTSELWDLVAKALFVPPAPHHSGAHYGWLHPSLVSHTYCALKLACGNPTKPGEWC